MWLEQHVVGDALSGLVHIAVSRRDLSPTFPTRSSLAKAETRGVIISMRLACKEGSSELLLDLELSMSAAFDRRV